MKCELEFKCRYSLIEAYTDKPHVLFMNANSEDKLAVFVQTWGPLWIPDPSPKGTSWTKIEWYWLFQRDLKATSGLFRAFRNYKGEEKALAEFLAVKQDQNLSPELPSTAHIHLTAADAESRVLLEVGDDRSAQDLARQGDPSSLLLDWNAKVDSHSRHRAIAGLIGRAFTSTVRMHANWQERPSSIEVLWELNNLEDALSWMVLQDAQSDQLPQICSECQQVFRPSTRHRMKFCSYECAHRVAARNWRTRDSRQKKFSTRKER